MNDWIDRILFHTRAQPETPALVMEDRVVTYGMLSEGIECCGGQIVALAAHSEGPVAVVLADPIRHLTLCLALLRCGIPSISLDPSQTALADLTLSLVLGDEAASAAVAHKHRFLNVDGWFATDPVGVVLPPGFSDRRQICRMNLTSGSTGEPKLVRFTVEDIGRRTGALSHFDRKRLLCLPGLSSAWGFWTACATLAAGGTLGFSASPFQSIRMIELFAIDYVMSSTDQLVALTRVARTTEAQLSSLRVVEVGGNPPTRALLESAMIHVCRKVYCRYGASETGLIARAPARDLLSRPAYAGRPLPGIEVAIVDRDGKPCAPGEAGLIRCRPDLRWFAKSAPAGWVDLGDLGWLTEGGELFVVGRAADAADLASGEPRAISPIHEAEHLLRLEWDAADAAAAVIGDAAGRPQIAVGTVDCKDASAEKLESMLRARGIDCAIRLVPVQAIPRLASGKVDRTQLKAQLLAQPGPAQALGVTPYRIRIN